MKDRTGIETLRLMVKNYDGYCGDGFLSQFSLDELVLIHRLWMKSGWDISPNEWSERQMHEALYQQIIPKWNSETEEPEYLT